MTNQLNSACTILSSKLFNLKDALVLRCNAHWECKQKAIMLKKHNLMH